jgi:hypothetical protein
MFLFITCALLTLSATSHAAPLGDRMHGRSFRMGPNFRRNVGFRSPFARNQNRRFLRHGRRVFFQQLAWPVYWSPYDYPYDYSYLDDGPDDNDQYSVASTAPVQPEPSRPAVDRGPVVVVINKGDPLPTDSRANAAYIDSVYRPAGLPRTAVQDPNEKTGPPSDPNPVIPPVPQPAQTVAKGTQATPPAQSGVFGNLVLVSWLEDAGKDVIYVQNTETNDVQKITSEPNLDNFRILELHRNADPKLFEAIISNGTQQGPVRFRF